MIAVSKSVDESEVGDVRVWNSSLKARDGEMHEFRSVSH